MTTSIQAWLERYAESHQHPTNKRIHHICVPLIFMTLVGFLYNLNITFALIISLLAGLFYGRLGIRPLLIFLILVAISVAITKTLTISNPILLLMFILGWIGQFIGHRIEGVKPSFMEDLQFLLIGPLWVFARFLR